MDINNSKDNNMNDQQQQSTRWESQNNTETDPAPAIDTAVGALELSVQNALAVQGWFTSLDAQVVGFRLGIEAAKVEFMRYLHTTHSTTPQHTTPTTEPTIPTEANL